MVINGVIVQALGQGLYVRNKQSEPLKGELTIHEKRKLVHSICKKNCFLFEETS